MAFAALVDITEFLLLLSVHEVDREGDAIAEQGDRARIEVD